MKKKSITPHLTPRIGEAVTDQRVDRRTSIQHNVRCLPRAQAGRDLAAIARGRHHCPPCGLGEGVRDPFDGRLGRAGAKHGQGRVAGKGLPNNGCGDEGAEDCPAASAGVVV